MISFDEIKKHLPPNYSDMETTELEKLANQNNQQAMLALVERYSRNSPTKYPIEAFQWVLRLSENGNWQAHHWLVDCYFTGEYVGKVDSEKAISLLEKYADEGDYIASVRLAYYYCYGKGTHIDLQKAVKFLDKIIVLENANKKFVPYRFFTHKNSLVQSWNFCSEFNYSYEEPRYKLAEIYILGRQGIQQDFKKAVDYLNQAICYCNLPYDDKNFALFKLGECYLTGGIGLEKDYKKAIEWFEKSAANYSEYNGINSGHNYFRWNEEYNRSNILNCSREAQRQLGLCYALGKGVDQNFEKAKEYFEKAARKYSVNTRSNSVVVDPLAEAELGVCYYKLNRVDNARQCFESATEKGSVIGSLWLAYLDGIEVKELREKTAYVPYFFRSCLHIFNDEPLSDDEKQNEKIDNIEREINNRLKNVAEILEAKIRKDECTCLDILDASDEIISFLKKRESNYRTDSANVILALYYFYKSDIGKYLSYLENAAICKDIIAQYLLGKHYKYLCFNKAEQLFLEIINSFKLQKSYSPEYCKDLMIEARAGLKDIGHSKEQEEKNKELEKLNNSLTEKDKELEDMMSMFAHKFRSPLDAIIYNTNHENNPKLYIEAAQTMRGLLEVFSIISTDEKVLKSKIKTDNQGNSSLLRVLSKTLNMILLHLLSASGADKIQQHYMAYAKTHGKIDSSVTPKIWNEDYFELERTIQTEWESSFSELLSKSGSLQECLDWIEQHFFKLELIGFERDDIQFKEYSVTESFLTILFNEILVNAFKYYSSESKQSVVLELDERDGNQIIICRNPSVKRERTTIKGSGKGHVFLSALASKIGSIFFKPKPQDDFVVEFTIPSELLISNQGGKNELLFMG